MLIGVAVLTVFGFLASKTLNANDFFLNGTGQRRPLLRQNQSGLGIGGPIKNEKLFFFGSYQRIRQLNGIAAGRSKTTWYIVGGLSLTFAEALLIFEMFWLRAKRRKIENALVKSEEKFSKAFRQSPLSVALLTVKDSRYIDVNETFEWITGWSRADVIGRTPFDIGLQADPEASLDNGKLLGMENAMQEVSNLTMDMQRLSHRLHSPKLEFLGLARAAAGYCGEVADQHKVQIYLGTENMPGDLLREISLSVFRVLQEALQNAIKHSGSQRFECFSTAVRMRFV